MKNVNYMRDLMLTGFELSRKSGVPMLYLGNPGVGKTTIVKLWAKRNGYHVESLIGSAFDRSEILGYMVNDGAGSDHLRTKAPEWFYSIQMHEKAGTPSILFIDEIAGAPKDVQASLYRLIFERTIGNGQMLPESTIIASASNYKENLPSMCDITSPNLNRFCVVNFGPQSFEGLYSEFLQEPEELEQDLPAFSDNPLTEEMKAKSLDCVRHIFDELNAAYNVKDSSKGDLNVKNKCLHTVFDADYSKDGEVYNFISGRTIGYFKDIFRAMYQIGLTKSDYIGKFTDGLIGLGFNSFADMQELHSYRKFVRELTRDALGDMRGKKKKPVAVFSLDSYESISQKVTALSAQLDKLEAVSVERAAGCIFSQIADTFRLESEAMADMLFTKSQAELSAVREDYNAVAVFCAMVDDFAPSEEKDLMLRKLQTILLHYKFYASTCIQTEVA